MPSSVPCTLCPEGVSTIWVSSGTTNPVSWTRLVHLDKWELVANRTEAPKKRTSDTGGAARKFCSDILDWTVNLTNTLCETDWLYCDILDDPTNPSVGVTAYWFLGWDASYLTGTTPGVTDPADFVYPFGQHERGVYVLGQVVPGGFGLDNTTSDPATAEWSIEVSGGPWFPNCTTGDFAPSDGDATS